MTGMSIRAQAAAWLNRLGYHSRPRFLIIGAQKAGTVALKRYLRRHPDIIHPTKKELVYFNEEGRRFLAQHPSFRPVPDIEGHFFAPDSIKRSRAWYHSHFPPPHRLGLRGITFEATPGYLYYPGAAERIADYNPRMKLVVLLRDPIERAYSGWGGFHELTTRTGDGFHYLAERRSFEQAISEEIAGLADPDTPLEPSYVRRGIYFDQLQRYFKYFHRDQMLILDSRALRNDTAGTLARVTQFLGLRQINWAGFSYARHHVRQYKEPLPDRARTILSDFYRPHNERLYQLLQWDLGWQ